MLVRKNSMPLSADASSFATAEDDQSSAAGSLAEAQTVDALASPGKLLQQARINKGLTEQEVADSLHLSLQWVQDIEADKFSSAPALIYIRGYLRGYARLADLPANAVLDAFAAMGWEEVSTRDEQDWLLAISKGSSRRRLFDFYKQVRYGFAIVGLIILLLLVALWWYVGQKHRRVATGSVSATAMVQPVLAGQKQSGPALHQLHDVSKTKNTSTLRQNLNNQQNATHNKQQNINNLQNTQKPQNLQNSQKQKNNLNQQQQNLQNQKNNLNQQQQGK
jgi:cytoskeleton protein RodZ